MQSMSCDPPAPSESPLVSRPHALRLGQPSPTAVKEPSRQLTDAIQAFTQEQRLTNEILREVAASLAVTTRLDLETRVVPAPASISVGDSPQGGKSLLSEDVVVGVRLAAGFLAGSASSPAAAPTAPITSPSQAAEQGPLVGDNSVSVSALDSRCVPPVTSDDSSISSSPTHDTWKGMHGLLWWTDSFCKGGKQLIFYNFDALQDWAALPLILCQCSVFRLRRPLTLQLSLQLLIVALITSSLNSQGYSAEELSNVREQARSIIDAADQLSRLVPFLLGLFVSLCLRRWWTMRAGYLQKVHCSSSQLSFWLTTTLPSKCAWIRERVEQDCLLGHKLLFYGAGGHLAIANLEALRDEGALSDEEFNRFHMITAGWAKTSLGSDGFFDFDLAALPFSWAAQLIYRVFHFGVITKGEYGISLPAPVCIKMLGLCMDAKRSVENVDMMLSQPLPFPYVQLVCLLVHFSALFTSVRAGIILGTSPSLTATQVVFDSLTVLIVNSLYCGLLCLCAVLTDPFGNDSIDFPAKLLQHKLWKSQFFSSRLLGENDAIDKQLYAKLADGVLTPGRRGKGDEDRPDDDEEEEEDEDDDDDGDGD